MSQTQIKQFNFTEAQIAKLCKMQDELNTYIHPDWKAQGFDWETAVNDECLEILGHLGWKWWKDKTYKQGITEANKAQIKLELIDLLHFVISSRIEWSQPESNGYIHDAINIDCNIYGGGFYEGVKCLQQDALHYGISSDSVNFLANLMHRLDMTEQEILETYTQKYVLNKFRQDHGYKDGSYVKEWKLDLGQAIETLEDNEALSFEVFKLRSAGKDTTDETILYERLELRYNSRLNK
jgi:dimeric dUTPase (all-alpha-NTP-PPase superfamily)